MFDNTDLIYRYSRADAIRDGVLIDMSAAAREAGIRYPVALTRGAWERCVAVPPVLVAAAVGYAVIGALVTLAHSRRESPLASPDR
jgi:hypothetical protein